MLRRAGSVIGASFRRRPRGGRAPRAGRSGRSRAGSGCRGTRTASPGASRTPSAWTSSAAQSSIRTPGTVRRGNPIDPRSRPDPREAVGPVVEERVEELEVGGDDPARAREDLVAGTQRDDRQDLRRRRRADRRVVLERGQPAEQLAVVRRQPADAQARHRVGLRHDPERDAPLERVGAGRQAVGLVELEAAIDLVDQQVRAGLRGDRDERRRRSPGRAASRSGCAGC